MVKKMVKEYLNGQMVVIMKVIGGRTNAMAAESKSILTGVIMKVRIGGRTNATARKGKFTCTGVTTSATGWKTNAMAREFVNTLTGRRTPVGGRRAAPMVG